MKICILHTGHPKTGSTSLQHYLAANAEALLADGILYPILTRKRDLETILPWARYQHGPATKTIAGGKDARDSGGPVLELERQMREIDHKVLIISSESLFLEVFFKERSPVARWFLDRGYQIETISYLRDQPDRFNSAYSQYAKTINSGTIFRDYVVKRIARDPSKSLEARPMHYGMLTDPAHAAWGTHHFRPFAAEVKRKGIEADFTATLQGILSRHGAAPTFTAERAGALVLPPRQNEGDGPVLVEAGRRIAEALMPLFPAGDMPQVIRSEAFRELSAAVEEAGIVSQKYFGITPRLYARIRRHFHETNELFARKIWGCSWSDHFPTRRPEELVPNDVHTTEDPQDMAKVEAIVSSVMPRIMEKIETGEGIWDRLIHFKPVSERRFEAKARRQQKRRAEQGKPAIEAPAPTVPRAATPLSPKETRRAERRAARKTARKARADQPDEGEG